MPIPPKPSGMEPELGTGSRSEEAERWYQAHDLYHEAQVRLVRQDRPGAATLLRQAVERSPQHAEAKALLAAIEEIEQQEREVQAARAEAQHGLEPQAQTRLSRGLASIHLNGPLGIGVALTSAVLGMIGGIVSATTLVVLADLGSVLRYGGYWMMAPLAGGMFCGATCGLIVYFTLEQRPILGILPALVAALLAGAVGGIVLPFAVILASLASGLGWAYRRLRRRITR